MKIRVILLGALLAALGGVCVARSEPAGRLNLADPIDDDAIDLSRVSYVIVSTETGEIVEARWERLDEPMPVGSLVKPFTALAYAESHSFRYPVLRCCGAEDECWLPKGHGTVGIEQALAQSCNTYFHQLADRVLWADIETVARRFGLAAPPIDAPAGAYIGLGSEWKLQPLAVVRAYEELVRRSGDPGIAPLVQGLALSSRNGTGSGMGRALGGSAALTKTGTSPCSHLGDGVYEASNGDGYVIALYPAETPRYTMLVQVHGVSGRVAAIVGGKILARLVQGR